jgi:hypothetical protein
MTTPTTNQSTVNQVTENKPTDKELNFRQLEAKYEKERVEYQRALNQERSARMEAERIAQESSSKKYQQEDDEDSSEPYVDHKRLARQFSNFEKKIEEKIDKKAEEKARMMMDQNKKDSWLRQNPDFYEVLQHAEKFAQKDPELAESILEMPEGFERQKLVYKNIKAFGLHKPAVAQPTIQEKVDANKRSPYYQPSTVGTAPYASAGDYSPGGQKNAYDKMKELQARLRI